LFVSFKKKSQQMLNGNCSIVHSKQQSMRFKKKLLTKQNCIFVLYYTYRNILLQVHEEKYRYMKS
jgi:hypothetical protein